MKTKANVCMLGVMLGVSDVVVSTDIFAFFFRTRPMSLPI